MDIESLKKDAEKATETPESAVKYLIDCLYVYQMGNDDALGYLGYVINKKELDEDMTAPSGYKIRRTASGLIAEIRRKKNCIVSSMGATWENDYEDIDVDNYTLPIQNIDELGGYKRVFLKAGGRDIPFPIKLKQNSKGEWKIFSYSSLLMDVRKPKSEVDDF
ncbi:MAG: DUF6935 domain-containing protein [Promethearchaeota archaeon]